MSAWGPNGLPPGVNLGGAIGGGFVQPERLPELNHHDYYRGSAEWGYQPPSRLANPVRSWVYDLPVTRDLSIIPKPEPVFRSLGLEYLRDPDPQYTLGGGLTSSKPERTWERKDPELAMLDGIQNQIRERQEQMMMRAVAGLARSRSGR